MAGKPSPQNPLKSRLTSQPEPIPSCSRRMRHTEFQPHSGRHPRLRQRDIPRVMPAPAFHGEVSRNKRAVCCKTRTKFRQEIKSTRENCRLGTATGTELSDRRPDGVFTGDRACIALPLKQGKQDVATSNFGQIRKDQGPNMPAMPSIDDAIRYYAGAPQFRAAHLRVCRLRPGGGNDGRGSE